MTQKQERNTSTFPGALCGFWWCLSIILLTVLDQWTKHLAEIHLKGNQGISLIPGVLELSYLENRGMAFGMFQGRQVLFLILCMAFFAVLLYLYARIPKNKYYLPLLITGAALASGALGNFIDRLLYGYVIDFIYVSLIDFPVFNVADIFVVCGGIAFDILVGFCYKDEDFDFIKRKRDNS